MVGGDDHRTLRRDVLAPDPAHPEVAMEERLEERPHEPVDERVRALLSRAPVQHLVIHRTLAYPSAARPLQLPRVSPNFDRTRTLRGAVCGAVAAAGWALQQPLDKLVFRSRFDDVELLGKAVTRGEGWYPAGLRGTSRTAPCSERCTRTCARVAGAAGASADRWWRSPSTPRRGHSGTLSDRVHPARRELPALGGNRRAFAQATWRHLLFGIILGELERRVNAEPEPVPPSP